MIRKKRFHLSEARKTLVTHAKIFVMLLGLVHLPLQVLVGNMVGASESAVKNFLYIYYSGGRQPMPALLTEGLTVLQSV